jgi:hypothetical protein
MEKIMTISVLIVIFFFIIKILEMKYIDKEWKPLRIIVRDMFIVFISSLCGSFFAFYFNNSINEFFNIVTQKKVLNSDQAQVFTGEPGF